MDTSINPTVFVVQSAVMEVFESIDYITAGQNAQKQDELKSEAQRTVLMMIAAVVLANGQYEPERWSFLSVLINWQDLPGGEIRYLNEYATKWIETSRQIPKFFSEAIEFDRKNQNGIARSMLREIQSIGNAICGGDGTVRPAELQIVRAFIEFLEDGIRKSTEGIIAERLAPQAVEISIEADQPGFQEPESRTPPIEPVAPTAPPPIISSPRKSNGLQWIEPGDSVEIGNFKIPGMVYVNRGFSSVQEASAINVLLPVGDRRNGYQPLNYYPNYSSISPDQRAI